MKIPERWQSDELKHRFVLTPEEKRVICFVIAALLLGVGTKCYRDTHPRPPVRMEKKHRTPTSLNLKGTLPESRAADFRAASKSIKSTSGSRH